MADDKGPFDATARLGSSTSAVVVRSSMAPRVALVAYHAGGAHVVPLEPGGAVVIGREAPADLVVADKTLSRCHARFVLDDGQVIVEDMSSTNGTRVRGARVERAALGPGDEAALGGVVVSVHVVDPFVGAARLPGHETFRTMLEDELTRARHFHRPLVVVHLRAAGGTASLSRWAPKLSGLLRSVDRFAVYGPDAAEILLPEVDGADAATTVHGWLAATRADAALVAGVATFPELSSAEELVEASRSAAHRASPTEPVVRAAEGKHVRDVAGAGAEGPVVASPKMRALFELVDRVARAAIPVLVLGETGTGKELLARAIHERGPRRGAPLVAVNCGAIPATLVESTLFGHERGAFTGALQTQRGVFEAADGGTVFLDEIGELPAPAQAALLRVLETQRVARVGSTKETQVDVRVVAATHKDLEAMCRAGTFRQDLLYRLNTMTLTVPPLRERPEDVAPLCERFLRAASASNGRAITRIDPAAMDLLRAYRWPGNVRELKNAVDRAVVIAGTDVLDVDALPDRVREAAGPADDRPAGRPSEPSPGAAAPPAREPTPVPADGGLDYHAQMQRHEIAVLLDALRRSGGSQTAAAELLGMPLRTLKHKIKTLGIKKLGFGTPDE